MKKMTRSTISSLLLLSSLAASQVYLCQANAPSDKSGLRTSVNHKDTEREHKRGSVIQRLYGPENGGVRKHIRIVEEKSERSRTGFMGDPDHRVPYDNHPYQETYNRRRREQERNLQDTEFVDTTGTDATVEEGVINTVATDDTTSGEDLYKPLRIRFETQALDDTRNAENAAKIDFFKTRIFPE